MSSPLPAVDRLYGLLPQIVRLRDIESGQPLREFLDIMATQVEVISDDLDRFYADQFIETAADWVVPYIGDLIGYRLVNGRAPGAPSPRAEVANTIAYRRRKGTASMIEQLARDVTEWPARAVEFFERLATTQYLNHPRPHAVGTVDLRRRAAVGEVTRLAGAFDDVAHTADVRAIGATAPHGRGRHNIPNLGIFLFRTQPMPLQRSNLRSHSNDRQRYRFDPLGADTQLFSNPVPETEITHLATPANVPLPLTVRWFDDHVTDLYRADRGLMVEVRSGAVLTEVPLADVLPSDLSDHAGGWANQPPAGKVAIDPERGRVYFGSPLPAGSSPVASFYLGSAVPVGARTIIRREAITDLPQPTLLADGGGSLQPGLDSVADGGTLRLQDSARWTPSPTVRVNAPGPGQPTTVVAVVSEASARPLINAPSGLRLEMAAGSTLLLDGLMIAGGPVFLDEAGDDQFRSITLTDCTLVPGITRTESGKPARPEAASLIVLDPFATVTLQGCITGPIVLVEGARLVIDGSIIDAGARTGVAISGREAQGGLRSVSTPADLLVGDGLAEAGEVRIAASTVIGGVHAVRLDTTDSILLAALGPGDPRSAPIWTQRRQVGCQRFSWLPAESRTGRRFRCQPDREASPELIERMVPQFTSLRFGDAAYGQLAADTLAPIRRGAEDESEMGATHDLYAPQREDDVTTRLEEYLRYGMEAGIFYAT
ncbi:hypothetical protein GCM10027020_06110 [Nocardioides salsibiostraticola]